MTPNDLRTMRTALMGRLKEIIKLPRPTEIVPASASLMDDYSCSAKDPAVQRSGQHHSKNEYEDDTEFLPSAHLMIELDVKPVPHLPSPETQSPSPRKNVDLLLSCAYCSYECTNGHDAMERHLMIRHPETFFMSQRNNSSLSTSWKNDHFKDIVMEIVLPIFILTDGISTSSTSCSCSVCGKKYSKCKSITVNSNLMTVHILSEHLQEVREYLKDIMGQSDRSLQKKLDKMRNNQKAIVPPKLEDCSSSIKNSRMETTEKPEVDLKPHSPPPEQSRSTRTGRRGLDRVRILTREKQKKKSKKKVKVKKHPKKKFQQQNIDSNIVSTTSSKNRGIHICKLCSKSFAFRQSAQRHWKYFCMKREKNTSPPIFSKRTGKTICKFCNKSFTHLVSAQRHIKYSCPKKLPEKETDSISKLACAYCSYECAQGQLMKRHLVRRHPEMFFLSERESFLSRWNNDQEQAFKMIVEKIVFPKFILMDNVISSSCSCSICGKNYSVANRLAQNRNKLKMHLINDHIQEVREYLQRIIVEKSDEASLPFLEEVAKLAETEPSIKTESEYKMQDGMARSPCTTSLKSKHNCKFCNESFTRLYSLQRHLKYSCPKGQRLTRPKSPQEDADLKLTCTYCNYECANRPGDMKRHLGVCHPETFFLAEMNDSSLSSTWKREHFKTIVMEMLFPKFILSYGSSVSCSCYVCGKVFMKGRTVRGNRNKMTLHLINSHFQEVREHLRNIIGQSDKSLEEQLDNMRKRKSIDKLMRSVMNESKTNLCHEEIKMEKYHNSLSRSQDTIMDVDETLINNLLGI